MYEIVSLVGEFFKSCSAFR